MNRKIMKSIQVLLSFSVMMTACYARVTSAPMSLRVNARELPDAAFLVKPDTYAILKYLTPEGHWNTLGRTNVVHGSNNPDYPNEFTLTYEQGKGQLMMMEVWEIDVLTGDDPYGNATFFLDRCTPTGSCTAGLDTGRGYTGMRIV